MSTLTRLLPLLLLCAVHLLSAVEVRANDPVVISKGDLGGRFHNYTYHIEGRDFAATGVSEDGNVSASFCSPCRPGSVISGDGYFDSRFGSGELKANGLTYPEAFHEGYFRFKSGSVTLPPAVSDITIKMPFTFDGVYRAYTTSARNVTPIFETPVRGQGVATIKLRITIVFPGAGYHYEYVNIAYDFSPKEMLRSPVIIREPTWWQRLKSRTPRKM